MAEIKSKRVERMLVTFSDGTTEEFKIDKVKAKNIKDAFLSALMSLLVYLESVGHDCWDT
jgi:hypothetical protein